MEREMHEFAEDIRIRKERKNNRANLLKNIGYVFCGEQARGKAIFVRTRYVQEERKKDLPFLPEQCFWS